MTATSSAGSSNEPDAVVKLAGLVERVKARDDDALPELREVLGDPELWRYAAGLAAAVKATWAGHLAAEGFAAGDTAEYGTFVLPTAPSEGLVGNLERLLADYVEACRLHVAYAEGRAAQPLPSLPGGELQRRVTAANRRWRLAGARLELVRVVSSP